MIQWIIVAAILAAALLYVCRRLLRSHRRSDGNCACCDAHCPLRKNNKNG